MKESIFVTVSNGGAVNLAQIPCSAFAEFRSGVLAAVRKGDRRVSAFAVIPGDGEERVLCAVLTDPAAKKLEVALTRPGASYPSLTPDAPAFHWFEREIWEKTGIRPEGHPWLKPIRFSAPNAECGVTDYFTMDGDAVHEVAVGPVHAGVIEPGHFRFQCMGERVYSLEIELGYQHRGIERMLTGGPDAKSIHLIETAAGDTSIASACCYARILEALGGASAPSPRAEALRQIALELERIANHTGDLGALAGDVAFLPTASYCGRIRGEFLNLTASLCGNRFGRGLVTPGGVTCDPGAEAIRKLRERLADARKDLENALELMFESPGVLDRLENTGTVSRSDAESLGLVGPAARASGLKCDARIDLGNATKEECEQGDWPVEAGDVFSRALIRRRELTASLNRVERLLRELPAGEVGAEDVAPGLSANALALSVTEAWRGELCHLAVTDGTGKFRSYQIVDPSFHNWSGLALALRGEEISNFPIVNKSFNLSYCGHDL